MSVAVQRQPQPLHGLTEPKGVHYLPSSGRLPRATGTNKVSTAAVSNGVTGRVARVGVSKVDVSGAAIAGKTDRAAYWKPSSAKPGIPADSRVGAKAAVTSAAAAAMGNQSGSRRDLFTPRSSGNATPASGSAAAAAVSKPIAIPPPRRNLPHSRPGSVTPPKRPGSTTPPTSSTPSPIDPAALSKAMQEAMSRWDRTTNSTLDNMETAIAVASLRRQADPVVKKTKFSPVTAAGILARNQQEIDLVMNLYLQAIIKNPHLLLEFVKRLPKGELHTHLCGAIPPHKFISYAIAKGYWIDPVGGKFYEKAAPSRVLVSEFMDLPQYQEAREKLITSMKAQKDAISFFKAFAPGDSLTDTWLMDLYGMLECPVSKAVKHNVLHTEYMKGVMVKAPEGLDKALGPAFKIPTPVLESGSDGIKRLCLPQNEADLSSWTVKSVLSIVRTIGYVTDAEFGELEREFSFGPAFEFIKESQVANDCFRVYGAQVAAAAKKFGEAGTTLPNYIFIAQVDRGLPMTDYCASIFAATNLPVHVEKFRGVTIAGEEASITAIHKTGTQLAMLQAFCDRVNGKKLGEDLDSNTKVVKATPHAGEYTDAMLASAGTDSSFTDPHLEFVTATFDRGGHLSAITPKALDNVLRRNMGIEFAPTSNETILGMGVEGHPAEQWIKAGADVSINGDDEGVLGITLSGEWAKVVSAYKLSWERIRSLVRGTYVQAFLKGESIYEKIDGFYHVKKEFQAYNNPQAGIPVSTFQRVEASEKARMQLEIEKSFKVFEDWVVAKWESMTLT